MLKRSVTVLLLETTHEVLIINVTPECVDLCNWVFYCLGIELKEEDGSISSFKSYTISKERCF